MGQCNRIIYKLPGRSPVMKARKFEGDARVSYKSGLIMAGSIRSGLNLWSWALPRPEEPSAPPDLSGTCPPGLTSGGAIQTHLIINS